MSHKGLGTVELPARTLEHDFTILRRYQEFSAELLRISLIAISAIGYAISKTVLGHDQGDALSATRGWVIGALVFLCLAAAAALVHRYSSADSMSWHLEVIRHSIRGLEGDDVEAARKRRWRKLWFNISRGAIFASALSLAVGTVLVVVAIVKALPQAPT